MRFSFGFSFARRRAAGGTPTPTPTPTPPPSNPTFDAQDFTATGTAGYSEVYSASAMGAARDGTTGANRGALELALEAGTYRLRGDLTTWAGIGNVTEVDLRLLNAALAALTMDSGANTYSAAGPVDSTFTLTSAETLILRPNQTAKGFTFTANGVDPILEKTA